MMTRTETISRLCALVADIEELRADTKSCWWVYGDLQRLGSEVQHMLERIFEEGEPKQKNKWVETFNSYLDEITEGNNGQAPKDIKRQAMQFVLEQTGHQKDVDALVRNWYRHCAFDKSET